MSCDKPVIVIGAGDPVKVPTETPRLRDATIPGALDNDPRPAGSSLIGIAVIGPGHRHPGAGEARASHRHSRPRN